MSDENKILNIKKLKVECKKCKTEIILALGDTAYKCPVCGESFINGSNNHFKSLANVLTDLATHHTAEFSLICEKEQE